MNQTKYQHYISQVEQRFNCCNPLARVSNQRIYQFKVKNRDSHELQLVKIKGAAIRGNLAMLDLFTFDVREDKQVRHNFERAFQKYEAQLQRTTDAIMRGHAENSANIGAEIFEVLVAKFVNFVRSPYCVHKMLNTFGKFGTLHPTNPDVYRQYERILNGMQTYRRRKLDSLPNHPDRK